MLPSPRWPNGTGPAAGHELVDRGVRLVDEMPAPRDRHRDVVLDRAALGFCASAKHLAHAPERLGLLEAGGDGGVGDEAVLDAGRRGCLPCIVAQALAVPATTARSARTRDACSRADRATPVPCLSTNSMPTRAISSKLVTPPPARSCARLSSSSAACGEGTPTKAVSTARGRGNSFSTAAVMMPSVPSAPMNRFLRS